MRKNALIALCLLLISGCGTGTVTNGEMLGTFSFGVIADIQHADKDTSGRRQYRESLGNLAEAVEEFNRRNLAFTIQLGDLIDGNSTSEKTLADLNRVLEIYNSLSMPKYHVVGNHCLNAGEDRLREKLELKSFYYDFTVPEAPGWRFVVLDGNDAGYGILGETQLAWLDSRLASARAGTEKVIVFNHFGLLESAAPNHRMETPGPVLKLISESGCVVAYLAGHDHAGGYAFQDGIHHITLKGMVEAPPRNSYAVIEVSPARLEEIGFGTEPSRVLEIRSQ